MLGVFFYYPFRCQGCGKRFWRMQLGTRYARRQIDRRDYERLPIRVAATIVNPEGQLDAVATDISLNGCALELTSAVPQRPFTLLLHIGDRPIRIESAVARFVAGRAVGVEFRTLTPGARVRLVEYVGGLFTARQL